LNTHPMRWFVIAVAVLVFYLVVLFLTAKPAAGETSIPIARIPASEFRPVPDPTATPLVIEPETIPATAAPTRPALAQVAKATAVPVSVSPKAPAAAPRASTGLVAGTATWYCLPGQSVCPWMAQGGNYAAAGPALRAALGAHWRGTTVVVSGRGQTVSVKLIDWCACGGGHVIDLFASAMSQFVGADKTGRPLRGGFQASITW
jgi:hypothetical protein